MTLDNKLNSYAPFGYDYYYFRTAAIIWSEVYEWFYIFNMGVRKGGGKGGVVAHPHEKCLI